MHSVFAESKLQVHQSMGKTEPKLYNPLFILKTKDLSQNDHKF